MPTIKNKLNQPVLICLAEGRTVGLLASGYATVDSADLAAPHLKGFLERGEIVVMAAEQAVEEAAVSGMEQENKLPAEMQPEKKAEMAVETTPETDGQ